MEVAWCLFGSYYRYDECVGGSDTTNIWPGAGEGRKKNYLEEKRASYYHVKQG